ncbi:spermidine synthase [Effusibacillus consociatus]|uniref:Spermidine synthase n=1 Tax=Effusibacillus consociatus TaxID=1117041 RepID=A0ABV9PZZ8_9BACL
MRFVLSLFQKTKLIWKKRTPYQTVYVYEKGRVRYMRFASESWQGALDMRNKDRLLFPYQRFFLAYKAWLPEVHSFLALGVGTGTAIRTVRRQHPKAYIAGVDLDASVLQAAVEYFDCPCDDRTQLIAMHGRAFLDAAEQRFDLVFLDAFDSFSIPKSMRTKECFSAIAKVLEENGLLVVNVIGTLCGPWSDSFRTLYKTLRQVFPEVWILPVSRWLYMEQNILLIARKQSDAAQFPIDPADPEVRKYIERLYTRSIPTEDIPVYQDLDQ